MGRDLDTDTPTEWREGRAASDLSPVACHCPPSWGTEEVLTKGRAVTATTLVPPPSLHSCWGWGRGTLPERHSAPPCQQEPLLQLRAPARGWKTEPQEAALYPRSCCRMHPRAGMPGAHPHLRCSWDLAGPSLLCLCLSFEPPLKSYPFHPGGKLVLQLPLPAQAPQPTDNIPGPQIYPPWVRGMCVHLSPSDLQGGFLRDIW